MCVFSSRPNYVFKFANYGDTVQESGKDIGDFLGVKFLWVDKKI